MKKIFLTKSFKETQNLGKKLAPEIIGGKVLAFYGNLGSGKTTFIQGLAKGLGIKNNIISPTFILIRTYDLKSRISKFYHIDLYRIDGEKEIDGLGIEELINNPSNIIAIEWAEKIKNILPKKRIDIYFKESSENERQITIERID